MHSPTPSMCQTHVLEKRLSVILVVCLFVCLAQNSWQHESWHKTDESTKHLVRTDSIITNESQSQKGKMYQLLSVYFMPLCTTQLNPPPALAFLCSLLLLFLNCGFIFLLLNSFHLTPLPSGRVVMMDVATLPFLCPTFLLRS